jgi:hypothetical protein
MIPSLRLCCRSVSSSTKFSLSLVSNFLAVAPIQQCCQTATSSPSSSSLLKPTTVLLKPMRRRRLPVREPQAGDWLCSCGHSNSKFRRDCIKCNGPAPPLPLGESRPKLPGEDPHDWACACGKMNYRGNVNCHKCGMPKPAAPEAEQKNQMWKCAKCACLNRVNRKFCFQCRALQNVSAVAVNQDGKPAQ